ncbi:MAG: hypothetical protein O3A00_20605 [Planctomycetota bacterium]|nr:hypothetical protein [Planctomycetota bacterium]
MTDATFDRRALGCVGEGADEVLRYFAAMQRGKVSLSKLYLKTMVVAEHAQVVFR